MDSNDEYQQDEPSSCHLLYALEDLLKRSEQHAPAIAKIKYQSKSVDDLFLRRRRRDADERPSSEPDGNISSRALIELDLSGLAAGEDDERGDDLLSQRSRSAPILSQELYERELAAFVQGDSTQQQPSLTDSFVYNVDLSDSDQGARQVNSKIAIFFEDDLDYEPVTSHLLQSSLLTNCLTITEENEDELEQLDRDDELQQSTPHFLITTPTVPTPKIVLLDDADDETVLFEMTKHDDPAERLSPIYESPSPQPDRDDEKLIVYDIARTTSSVTVPPPIPCRTDPSADPCTKPDSPPPAHADQSSSSATPTPRRPSQHIQTMRVIQSSSSSLSDFISSPRTSQNTTRHDDAARNVHHSFSECSLTIESPALLTNPLVDTHVSRRILTNGLLPLQSRRSHDPLVSFVDQPRATKFLSETSSSSELLSSSDEKLLSRSDYILRHDHTTSQQRKASSLRSILATSPSSASKILYPIDYRQRSRAPIFDSGIITDVRPASRASVNEDIAHGPSTIHALQQHELHYRQTRTDLSLIKQNIVEIESRLDEAARELDIEQALIESEHELVFKQILDASESDQEKIRQLHLNLQLLVERIMNEKTSIRHQINHTQQILSKLEQDMQNFEQQYRSPDETLLQKRETLATMRKKYEDLEFQLMELEARCDAELEQAEEQFHSEKRLVTQNAKMRQTTLRELDHQQYLALHQAALEKEQLEREKQKLKLLYKQKKIEASEYEGKLQDTRSHDSALARANVYTPMTYAARLSSPKTSRSDDQHGKLNEMMVKIEIAKQQAALVPVQLREKPRPFQERPLTRYLPILSANFDLRAHIEGAGHLLHSPQLTVTGTSCRGYLHKMGGMKFKTWNRRWFVFDRQRRSLAYYLDRNETKLRGSIDFRSIVEVYVDQLQSISLRSPEPREATFIVKTLQRPYYLVAPTVELMRVWIDVIITGAEGNTFANV